MALIAIEHPDVETPAGGPPLVSERAFKSVWQYKGWTKIEGSDREPPQELILPDGSLDKQIRAAQRMLEEGQLVPSAEITGDAPVADGPAEGAPAPDGTSESTGEAPVAQTDAPVTAATTKTRARTAGKES